MNKDRTAQKLPGLDVLVRCAQNDIAVMVC